MPSRPGELLPPDRTLLFPRFETYRLRPLDPDVDLQSFPLPGSGATQSRVMPGAQQLGFKEMRARISWNHIEVSGSRGVYIDADWNVIGFELGDDLNPTFSTLASLPQPIAGSSEFPRALPLTSNVWAVSTGSGSLYILQTTATGADWQGQFIARYDLESPFLLYAAHAEEEAYRLLLACSVSKSDSTASKYKPKHTSFELLEVTLPTRPNGVDEAPGKMEANWTLQGGDLPFWTIWREGWLLLSEEAFEPPRSSHDETDQERQEREKKERLSKLGLGAHLPEEEMGDDKVLTEGDKVDEEAMDVDPPEDKAYPFRWMQDAQTLTMTFPVPPATTRKDIDLTLKQSSIMLSVASEVSPALSTFLQTPEHSLWTDIKVDESTWTYDATASELELTLTKVDENTRWPSVFVPADDESDTEDIEVPETFAPDQLAAIRESFSKVHTRDEPQGNHPAMPALLREEMDFDIDDGEDFGDRTDGPLSDLSAGSVGRPAFVGHISPPGKATWSRQATSVLSLPMDTSALEEGQGIIVKQAVDGLLFVPPADGDPARSPWKHTATTPALAFVLSSKRDLRLVRHLTSTRGTTVLAFDSGSGAGTGNAYVYYPASGDTAQQGLVGVSGGERGALLGVGSALVGAREVVVALTERELVVLGGVLE